MMPEALAAVTRWVPLSGASWQPVGSKVLTTTGLGDSGPTGNAPFSLAMLSAVTPALGYSSLAKGTISFLTLIITGTISSSNLPAAWAASVFCWEAAANSSCSRRVIPQMSLIFSAVVPM